MRIVVGTTNAAKIDAAKSALRRIWPDAEVVAAEVNSGVSVQPKSDDEAIEGALNRAKEGLKKVKADFGLGLEGTTVDTKYGMFLCGWVAVVDKNGTFGLGCTSKIQLPEKVAEEIRNGKELGPVMDTLFGEKDIKKRQGAVGVLTKNLITRKDAFEQAIISAFARFIVPEYYSK